MTRTTPLLLGVLALAACPSDDTSIDTEGTSTGDGDTTMSPTTLVTTIEPDSGSESSESGEPTTGGPVCEPECEFGRCCVAGSCFDAGPPMCDAGCGEDEDCVCPEGTDPCECALGAAECVPAACGVEGGYDPCDGDPCPAGYTCLVDTMGTVSWCALSGCADACDCPITPKGFEAGCADLLQDGTNLCSISCGAGGTCPEGMQCFLNMICTWPNEVPPPPPMPGYNPCVVPETGCAAGETCLDDGEMDPAWEVCAQDCTDMTDCTLLTPETGDAPVACGDPGGSGSNSCYLDCAGGATCPDGMTCVNDSLCSWPLGAELFADDFETGDLSAGWTLENVDGLTPDMGVAFVDDAWVVAEIDEGNLTAVSTSWYAPAGTSDDWLISPQIMLGANTRLYWFSRSFDVGFPDDLEVRISTATAAVTDFEANAALYTAAPESVDFTLHFIDLAPAGYMNQPVYIAFRNTTNDGNLLLVDNVLVAELP